MRKFHSYEEINKKLHYYVPRTALIEQIYQGLLGDDPNYGGSYITVWGPRQSGKTWIMREVIERFSNRDNSESPFDVAMLTMQAGQTITTDTEIFNLFRQKLSQWFDRPLPSLDEWSALETFLSHKSFSKPLILILDEFDSIGDDFINKFANQFRHIYTSRLNQRDKKSDEKYCLLHGLALIGVRSVLGVENVGSGSPFNVQRSLSIPKLTFKEVDSMFHWYEQESEQPVEQVVIDRIFYETQGQPGLVGWLGELLTEKPLNPDRSQPITVSHFERVYASAIYDLPNNNILNLISKVRQTPYRNFVLNLFNTETAIPFSYDDEIINYLYMNGVVDRQVTVDNRRYVKFTSPLVQKRLFNYFSRNLFQDPHQLYPPFTDLSNVITIDSLNVKNLLRLYERYLQTNRTWLLADAPMRKDLRIYEAVFHFNLYSYLQAFLQPWHGHIYPEFPTGNGQIDLLITYQGQQYGIEVKSFQDERSYQVGLAQSVCYGKRLALKEVVLVAFIEQVPDSIRQKYEAPYLDKETNITVLPIFVVTG